MKTKTLEETKVLGEQINIKTMAKNIYGTRKRIGNSKQLSC